MNNERRKDLSPNLKAAWIVAHTETTDSQVTDHWEVVATEEEARARYELLLTVPEVYCATYGQMADGTEPHWLSGDL